MGACVEVGNILHSFEQHSITYKKSKNGTELIEGFSRRYNHDFSVLRCNVVVLLKGQREASLSLSWKDASERRRTRMIAVKLAQSRKFGNKGG